MTVACLITCPLRAVRRPHDHVDVASYACLQSPHPHVPVHVKVTIEFEKPGRQVEVGAGLDDDSDLGQGIESCPA